MEKLVTLENGLCTVISADMLTFLKLNSFVQLSTLIHWHSPPNKLFLSPKQEFFSNTLLLALLHKTITKLFVLNRVALFFLSIEFEKVCVY